MSIYRNKDTGKLVEVLKGTKLPNVYEKVYPERKESATSNKKHVKGAKKAVARKKGGENGGE